MFSGWALDCTVSRGSFCFFQLMKYFVLFCVVQHVSCINKSMKYVLAAPAKDCDSACATKQMSCVTKNAFPNNALEVFHSLNVNCTTGFYTDKYFAPDQPNFILSGGWGQRCLGFIASPTVTNCSIGHNPAVRRLCRCQLLPTTAITTEIPTTAESTTTPTTSEAATTASTNTAEPHDNNTRPPLISTHIMLTEKNHTEPFSTWKIIIIVLVAVLIGGLIIVFLVKKCKHRKERHPFILSEQYQAENSTDSKDTKSRTSQRPESPHYECPIELLQKASNENVLYDSCDQLVNAMNSDNPLYGAGEAVYDTLAVGSTDGAKSIPEYCQVYASIDDK